MSWSWKIIDSDQYVHPGTLSPIPHFLPFFACTLSACGHAEVVSIACSAPLSIPSIFLCPSITPIGDNCYQYRLGLHCCMVIRQPNINYSPLSLPSPPPCPRASPAYARTWTNTHECICKNMDKHTWTDKHTQVEIDRCFCKLSN